jgi:hypothetical protein
MNKQDWKYIREVRIHVLDKEIAWSFPIKCPRWLFTILEMLQK